MKKFTVAKVKSFRGMEGYGYNAELRMDDKPVAFVIDEGCGGEPHFEWTGATAQERADTEKRIFAWIESQSLVALGVAKTEDECIGFGDKRPLTELYKSPYSRLEAMMARLVDEWENSKKLQRLAKANVIVRDGGKTYTFKIRSGDTRERVEAFIAKKYPTAVIVRDYNAA